MELVSTLRSLPVVSAQATGDCRGCASAAKALAASSRSGAKGTRAQKLNYAFLRLSLTQSLRSPDSAGSDDSLALPGDRARTRGTCTVRTRRSACGRTGEHRRTTLQVPA